MRKNIKGKQRQVRPHLRERNPLKVRRSTPLVAIFAIFAAFGLCLYGLYWAFESNYSDELSEQGTFNAGSQEGEAIEKSTVTPEDHVSLITGLCDYYGTSHSSVSPSSTINRVSFAEVQDKHAPL